MRLILTSISFGIIGMFIGLAISSSSQNGVFLIFCFGFIGFFSPALYVLNSIYKYIEAKEEKVSNTENF